MWVRVCRIAAETGDVGCGRIVRISLKGCCSPKFSLAGDWPESRTARGNTHAHGSSQKPSWERRRSSRKGLQMSPNDVGFPWKDMHPFSPGTEMGEERRVMERKS